MALSDSSEYIGWRLIVFVSVFTPLQIALVALRFYARSLTKAHYDIGDILVVIALIAGLVQTGICIGAEVQAGVGVHLLYLEKTEPEKITLFFKYLVAISVWYFATITITKLAICRLYRTLFPSKTVFYILIVTATILVLTPIATSITLLAACQPFSANWGSAEVQATHCINKEAVFVWGTIPNILTDIVLLVIPLPIVWKLHTTTKLKIALSLTFIIGSVGLLASILRFISFYNTNSFSDATFNADELIIWTIAEPGIYLISACLLVFRPLLEKFKTGISTKLGTYSGSVAKSRATSDSRDLDAFDENNRMNIALVSTGGHSGFVQLSDTEYDGKAHSSEQHIKVTTDIEQNYHAR